MYIKQELGKDGEEEACSYLKQQDYKIIERNFSCKQGEIDIVAWDRASKELVFIEVKTRTNKNYGAPIEAVTEIKQKHIYRSAEFYLYCHKIKNTAIRIDVIEVYLHSGKFSVNHIKQAFEKPESKRAR